MVKVHLYLKHESRTTRKEWWTFVIPRVGEFIDQGGVRYRVNTILHKVLQGGGSATHIFCNRLQKQPGRTANQWMDT